MTVSQRAIRVGSGIDVHRFMEGRKLVLGGVEIPHSHGLEGHSDADALIHALMDALLGAAGLGDIGVYFPPSDPAFKDADSTQLLESVMTAIYAAGWHVGNVDCSVVTEEPRLRPHIDSMRERLAPILKVTPSDVNIKAGTNERLGFVGRQEGLAAFVTVLLISN